MSSKDPLDIDLSSIVPPRAAPKLTQQQSTFVDAAAAAMSNLVLQSCAGSGKSTTIKAAAAHTPGYAITAFNKRIADALKDEGYTAQTYHSIGMKLWGTLCQRRLRVNNDKLYDIARQMDADRKYKDLYRIVSLAMNTAILPNGAPFKPNPAYCRPDTRDNWQDLIDDYDLDFDIENLSVARELLVESIKLGLNGTINFDDMLYLPVIYGVRAKSGPSILYVDEAQDTNPVQIGLAQLLGASRYAFVGDRFQAIYGFRGADFNALDNAAKAFDCQELRLTVCFRCPKSVIHEAQKFMPLIEPAPGAPEGVVRDLGKWDSSTFQPGDVILCRNNAPLVSLAFRLIMQRIPCRIIGRELGTGLKKILRKHEDKSVSQAMQAIEFEFSLLIKNAKPSKAEKLAERLEILSFLLENSKTVADAISMISSMFDTETAPITLSTIHRAKGLEWPRVYLLDRHLIGAYGGAQEDNIHYVGVTRAQEELIFIHSEEME